MDDKGRELITQRTDWRCFREGLQPHERLSQARASKTEKRIIASSSSNTRSETTRPGNKQGKMRARTGYTKRRIKRVCEAEARTGDWRNARVAQCFSCFFAATFLTSPERRLVGRTWWCSWWWSCLCVG